MDRDIIDELNTNAWKARIDDSIAAEKYSESAFSSAEKINYPKGIADALRTKGFCLIRLAKHKEAFSFLEKAKEIYEELNDQKGLASICEYFGIIYRTWGDFKSSLEHINHAILLSQNTEFIENEMTNHYQLGVTYRALGEYGQALESLDKSLSIATRLNHDLMRGYVVNVIGSIYYKTENFTKALDNYQQGLAMRQMSGDKWGKAGSLDNLGMTYLRMGNLEKAREHCNQSLAINKEVGDKKGEGNSLMLLAQIQGQLEDFESAIELAEACRKIRTELGDKKGKAEILIQLSKFKRQKGTDIRKAIQILDLALEIVSGINAKDLFSEIYQEYYLAYKSEQKFKKSIGYLEKYLENEKLLHKDSVDQKVKNMEITHKIEESKKEAEIFKLKNVELSKLYQESEIQKEKISKTLEQLKSTQAQLIQSEKMASLGELTAGIAHEIKNPLNFVNNFSEVNSELVDELIEEINNQDYNEAIAIAKDIKSNEDKIKHHGKRADSIVKNMLQHSRSGSGELETIDINALADEYLRLAFHGLRAKDSSFNALMETDFDENIGNIKVIPQDFGRVLLNLITNAFQAVNEKQKMNLENYNPLVKIETKKINDKIEIRISDNGGGIPNDIKDKIFQPFFTTKPTGEGTGLGLSMSYDIITKGHGGELEVESFYGKGSTFTIKLKKD